MGQAVLIWLGLRVASWDSRLSGCAGKTVPGSLSGTKVEEYEEVFALTSSGQILMQS